MKGATSLELMANEQDQRISEVVKREQSRLRNFIRRRVADPRDAEDILQDVFRKQKPENFSDAAVAGEDDDELLRLEDLLPSPDAGPDALYARNLLLNELELALDELPEEQREVFVAHELEGRSFKEIAAETGVGLNTLLSRKRYAVLHLRERLQKIYDDFTNAR